MTSKPKSRYSLTHSYVCTINHLKHYSLPTQLLKHFHQTYECCVTSTYLRAGLLHNRLETAHYLRSTYMPTAKSTTCPTTSESSTKTPSIFYNISTKPTVDEIHYAIAQYPQYADISVDSVGCNKHGSLPCNDCPFTTRSSDKCFLDLLTKDDIQPLLQSHPELFL